MKKIVFIILISSLISPLFSQDKGVFIERKNETWDKIQETIKKEDDVKSTPKKAFIPDFDKIKIPTLDDFKPTWHNPPVMQASTNTCWSFSATSFFESEIYRLTKKEIKLSEMFTVYHEYLDRVSEFVKTRGTSYFAEGSQANALRRIYRKYGCVPHNFYPGKPAEKTYHDHSKMHNELDTYLKFIKEKNIWNLNEVLANVKSILNYYLGVPPEKFPYNGKIITPKEFMESEAKLVVDDYVDILSLLEYGYYKQVEYDVPDNWWNDNSFYNVPLDEYMKYLRNAITNGYTVAIGGDVSEAGLYSYKDAAIIPSFDIPSQFIDENARQFRFSNGTTTDDHGIHIVGITQKDGAYWYLIKDSGSGAQNGNAKGYYFYREDYIKLKMMSYLIHKDAVKDLLIKFK